MKTETIVNIIWFGIAGLIIFAGISLYRKKKQSVPAEEDAKKHGRLSKLYAAMAIFGGWLFLIKLLPLVFGSHESGKFVVEISPPRYDLFGFSLSSTVVVAWISMAIILVGALVIRMIVVPRLQTIPKGIQNVLESAVGGIDEYAESKTEGLGQGLSSYLFSLAIFMTVGAAVELLGVRALTSDITLTLAMALITFFLINLYGIKRKGVRGRIKALANPTPVVLVLRVVSDCAIPISLACRLFGNMLGGMIVMELLYHALGSAAIGIPSVAGLYFNLFHPLIQIYIFITLTLTFINEAAE